MGLILLYVLGALVCRAFEVGLVIGVGAVVLRLIRRAGEVRRGAARSSDRGGRR